MDIGKRQAQCSFPESCKHNILLSVIIFDKTCAPTYYFRSTDSDSTTYKIYIVFSMHSSPQNAPLEKNSFWERSEALDDEVQKQWTENERERQRKAMKMAANDVNTR